MPRNAATNRFIQRNANAAILANGANGAAGNILSIANNASLNPTAAVTVDIWHRPRSLKAAILFDNSTGGVTNSYFVGIGADLSLLWYSTIGGLAKNITTTTSKLKLNEWNFITATYDGANIYLFANGAQFGTLAATGSLGTNSGSLFIGAYYTGSAGFTVDGALYNPRIYSAGCTLAEHQDRYYNGITSTALQAALELDLDTNRGAGTTVLDLSGNGNTATLGAGASWSGDVPFKSRKASVNANMVKNGDFEYAPPFTAATTTSSRWIDGTATGSTTNDLFRWYHIVGVANYASSFDTTTKRSGTASLKIEATDTSGRGRALSAPFEATTTESLVRQYGIPCLATSDYDLSCYIKTNNCQSNSIRLQIQYFNGSGTSLGTTNGTYQAGTQDWTAYNLRFTTLSGTQYFIVKFTMDVAGSICQAWLDDLSITPVYPEGRVPANGNLVKNFDFEVAPTFVAATATSARFIDGSSGGSTTNGTYKWAILSGSTGGTFSSQFDSSVFNAGAYSIKLSTLATASKLDVSPVINITAANLPLQGIPVNPSTSYTVSYRMKTLANSGSATSGATVTIQERDAAAGNSVSNTGTKIQTTTDWTTYTFSFTTASTTVYLVPRLSVNGSDGAGTLIMDAWFDDIYLAPTTNPGRVVIT